MAKQYIDHSPQGKTHSTTTSGSLTYMVYQGPSIGNALKPFSAVGATTPTLVNNGPTLGLEYATS